MGYIDPLGRFIRDPDVDSVDSNSSSNRKTPSNPIQFFSNLIRHDQDELVCSIVVTLFTRSSLSRQWTKQQHASLRHSSTKSRV